MSEQIIQDDEVVENTGDQVPSGPRRPPAKKYTGADIEAGLERWAQRRRALSAERAERRTPEVRRQRSRRVVVVALGIALAATAVVGGVSTRAYEDRSAANDRRITQLQLQAEIASATAVPQSLVPVEADEIAALSTRASQAATTVADKQQQFAVLYEAINDAPSANNGAPNKETMAMVEHRRTLAEHWDPSSYVVDEEMAYVFTTTPDTERDEIDPRFAWYVRYDGFKTSPASSYTWKVESVMPTLDAPGTARVVWTNTDPKGVTLAWASAVYTDADATFSDLELVVTALGAKNQATPEVAPVPELPEGRKS